jgi:hypothetical protein
MMLPLIALLLPLQSWSFEITKNKSNETLTLAAKSCAEVTEIRNSLAIWALESHDHKICPKDEPQLDKKKKICKVDITQCVPEHAKKFHDVVSKEVGPNCHNLVLVMKDILPALRSVTTNEFVYYMNSPLCRALENDEKRLPGDVGAIRSIEQFGQSEDHAFIYISDKIAYSKNGFGNDKKAAYALQSYDYVLNYYNVPQKKECNQNKIDRNSKCLVALSFYRCSSVQDYLKNTDDVPAQLMDSVNKVRTFEKCSLEPSIIKGTTLNQEQIDNIKDVSRALLSFLQTQKRDEFKNEKNAFILTTLQLGLTSIVNQLNYVLHPSTNEMEALSKIIFQEARKLTY